MNITQLEVQGVRLNRDTTCKVVQREVIYDLQVNFMFGNMYPNVVSIDNGPYFVFLRDLTVKYDRSNRKIRIFVNALKLFKLKKSVLLRRGKTDFFELYGYHVQLYGF